MEQNRLLQTVDFFFNRGKQKIHRPKTTFLGRGAQDRSRCIFTNRQKCKRESEREAVKGHGKRGKRSILHTGYQSSNESRMTSSRAASKETKSSKGTLEDDLIFYHTKSKELRYMGECT